MDIQMPVLDGHSATRTIREWERANGVGAAPIVALTAHALNEEIEKSLEAGCTAYLTKPIRKRVLIEAIEKYARNGSPMHAGAGPATVEIHVDSRLRELVPWFIEKRRSEVEVLLAALEREEFEIIRMLGHNMKGSGAGYGLEKVTAIGGALEQAAGKRNENEVRVQIQHLAEYQGRLAIVYD